jgi:para-aminobenzoate synthetase/4-amino-4-deoxychorismate lyase
VAIRTALIDRQEKTIEYGVGSGIVWDSEWESEYDECFAKAAAVLTRPESFDLFETMLWEPGRGFFLLGRHIERLLESARFFGWAIGPGLLEAVIHELVPQLELTGSAQRVRIFLNRSGEVRNEICSLIDLPRPYRVSLSRHPISSEDRALFHKTTARAVYESAEPEVAGVEDIILWNERGEITEARIANVVLDIDGRLYTPPVTSGLLAGCYRSELLASGEVQERVLWKDDLLRAKKVYLLNSLRRMWEVEVVEAGH